MRDKIIIVGGGFAGLKLARKLNNRKGQKVMLIDKVNHHMFQPLFYQVASGRIEPSNISFPFRKIFQRSHNVQFRMTEVQTVLPDENKIITADGTFSYDKLVIATGCRTNFFGNEKMENLTFGMKNTQEAISIRNHVLLTFEKLIIERSRSDDGNWNEKLRAAKGLPTHEFPGSKNHTCELYRKTTECDEYRSPGQI